MNAFFALVKNPNTIRNADPSIIQTYIQYHPYSHLGYVIWAKWIQYNDPDYLAEALHKAALYCPDRSALQDFINADQFQDFEKGRITQLAQLLASKKQQTPTIEVVAEPIPEETPAPEQVQMQEEILPQQEEETVQAQAVQEEETVPEQVQVQEEILPQQEEDTILSTYQEEIEEHYEESVEEVEETLADQILREIRERKEALKAAQEEMAKKKKKKKSEEKEKKVKAPKPEKPLSKRDQELEKERKLLEERFEKKKKAIDLERDEELLTEKEEGTAIEEALIQEEAGIEESTVEEPIVEETSVEEISDVETTIEEPIIEEPIVETQPQAKIGAKDLLAFLNKRHATEPTPSSQETVQEKEEEVKQTTPQIEQIKASTEYLTEDDFIADGVISKTTDLNELHSELDQLKAMGAIKKKKKFQASENPLEDIQISQAESSQEKEEENTQEEATPIEEEQAPNPQASNTEEKQSDDQMGIVTESMAKIYVLQGKKMLAIEVYQQLQSKFPEKSAYFAHQIEKLK